MDKEYNFSDEKRMPTNDLVFDKTTQQTLPLLENWAILNYHIKSPDSTMDFCGENLIGNIFNDLRFDDGESIITSNIIKIDKNYAYTQNTKYELGEKSDDYKAWVESFVLSNDEEFQKHID